MRSLGRVGEIWNGIRNPYDPADPSSPGSPSLTAEFWLNELRLSGFDNEKGWKANAKASFKLADFATVNTNFAQNTPVLAAWIPGREIEVWLMN
ncbi:hypothetical protein [Rhodohalobacter sp.]|uniref:hypothetical protein n=1 Tax=Rhodohalobacter sp. TaxID=1974210 RepID=UPI002ACE840E|nr:hypothetical protein [Rhodohalobacter sp.]MDZ7756052.1 hypothetical protein [Rhodohalobacter sp.]